MNRIEMNNGKTRSKRRAASPRAVVKPLTRMTKTELEALPEKEFVRRLSPSLRRSYRAAKILKGCF